MTLSQTTALERPSGRERLRGGLLCLIGIGLALAMAMVAWHNAATFLNPGELIDGSRFTGTLAQGRWALALIASVAVTGLAFAAMGVQLAQTGQRARRLTWLLAGAIGVTLATAWQLRSLLA